MKIVNLNLFLKQNVGMFILYKFIKNKIATPINQIHISFFLIVSQT